MKKNQIYLFYGRDPVSMAMELCRKADLASMIKPEMNILVKPNLVVGKPASSGATTSPETVEGVVRYLQDAGFRNISIRESCWTGGNTENVFRECGYTGLSKKYGVKLFDLKKDKTVNVPVDGQMFEICASAAETDFLINIPVLKGHCQVNMTCSLKNMKGCIPDSEKRRYHRRGLHTPIAYLNKAIRQDFILVDALQGDLTFEEGGTPVRMDRMFAGRDPVLVDRYAASLMGFSPGEIDYLDIAERIGVGKGRLEDAEIIEAGETDKQGAVQRLSGTPRLSGNPRASSRVKSLARHVVDSEACSVCYGSVIHALHRIDSRRGLQGLEKVYVGQGFRKRKDSRSLQPERTDGIGIGTCTCSFPVHLPGCPPKTDEVVRFLEEQL
jgi:uncharacterized protein (DUF362 family)